MDEIKVLYAEHLKAPFPDGLRGNDAAGQDLVMLDADIVGCVSTYLLNKSHLDNQRIEILKIILPKMDEVINELPQYAKGHYLRLKRLCELVLRDLKD